MDLRDTPAGSDGAERPERALLVVDDSLRLPLSELRYRASRSGGPGGQHVNTSSTRVELMFDVASSPSLTDEQRARITERLASRIDSRGVLHLTSGARRSQLQNRETVTARFRELLANALRERKPRKRTNVPRAAKQARLEAKRRRARTKQQRRPIDAED